MRLFARKNGKKRWREKALLVNPHKTRIIFVASKRHAVNSPPRIDNKLEEFACSLCSQHDGSSAGIDRPELALVNRIHQENNLEDTCDDSLDRYESP